MALSVYRLNTQVECEEPANEIQVTYHATDVDVVCAGGGSAFSIFHDTLNTLGNIFGSGGGSGAGAGTDEFSGGVTNPCAQGMDVVFVLDYSAQGHYAYMPVLKNQYTSYIGNKIDNLSGGDYRVGIVTYEGDTTLSSPAYSSSGFYQSLPAGQKIAEIVPGGHHFITCWQKMTQANNTTVSAVINALDSTNSNSTAVDGSGSMQPAGRALLEVGTNEFAGQWRNGVAKFIIVLSPDDADETVSYMQNTVLPGAEQNQIQHIVLCKNSAASSPSLSYIAGATTPVGSYIGGLNLAGNNWAQVDLPGELTNDCTGTTIYDCSPLAAGWYQEVGDTTAYYWSGTDWTSSNNCQYQVTINLVNGGSNVSLDNIASDHTYYSDADTYVIDVAYGTQFTLTNSVSANSGYTFSDIDATSVITAAGSGGTISVVTDTTDGSLSSNEYKITGTVTADMTFNVVITASANQNPQTASIVVVSDVADPFDANGQSQSPSGGITVRPHTPATWSNVAESYGGKSSLSYTFSETPGTTCSWRINFDPNPSDYTLNNISSSATYSSSTIQNLVNGTTTTNSYITGSFEMPSTSGHQIRYNISGGSDQPDYTYNLTAQISSGGGSISGAPYSQTYTGYTGDQFNFSISIVGSTDVQILQILSATESDSNISNVTINNVDFTVTGTVTMPSGGGSGDVDIVTRTQAVNHTFSVIINDPFTDNAFYSGHQFTGQTGSSHSQTISLQNTDSDTTYTVTGVSDNSIPLTVSNSGTDIVLSLGSMPSGGGSATVTVTGSSVAKQYNYVVEFKRGVFGGGGTPAWPNTDATSVYVTITGTAGSQQLASYDLVTPTNKWFDTVSVTENETALSSARRTFDTTQSYTSSQPNIANIEVLVTMPSNGGSGRVNVSGDLADTVYTHQLNIYTNSTSTVVNNMSTALVNSNNGVAAANYSIATTSTNGGGYSITFTGIASSSAENFHAAVQSSNATDYEAEIDSFSNTSPSGTILITGTHLTYVENNYLKEGTAFSFFMPGKDPRAAGGSPYADITNLVITASLIPQTLAFTLSYASNMSGVTPVRASDTLTGTVGTTQTYSIRYQADSSVSSFNITSFATSGTASIMGSISSPDISGSVTMPSGGGSSTLTASGTTVENCGCDFMSTPPMGIFSNPSFSGGSNGSLQWTLTDACGGALTSIEYKINSGSWQNASMWWSSSSPTSYSKTGLSAATYHFRFSFGTSLSCQHLDAITLTNPSSSGSSSGSGSGGGKELSPGGPEGIE
jgi:hypothetical protein